MDNQHLIQESHLVQRGKFCSLTLINWNGFFARTFDLDELVTTLSGGNGAGKSTTMAGFVTALIPDLTLLHFRNTTEAGASGGSRDKGLHGKLKAGVCYALLEAENSRNERIFMGVRLQQIAGRDKKVDIKPFSLHLKDKHHPTAFLTESIGDKQARVLPLNELSEKITQLGGECKLYHSIADYHTAMFDLGILPKRLRTASDRAKFYKLIEASLYGGISSAITRSLRDYLLPENLGVKKAFADMESALRENRMTLEAIKTTKRDRDLFKHLITESTQYVASDYMRHANERFEHIEQVLKARQTLFKAKSEQDLAQYRLVDFSRESASLKEREEALESEYQRANDHLNLVINACRHQEKITRYQEDILLLTEKIEEQAIVLEDAQEEQEHQQQALDNLEDRIDALRDELADYQQAIDMQQTRALQYNQAQQALEKAKEQCGLSQLNADNAEAYLAEFEAQSMEMTEQLLDLEQQLAISVRAKDQFDEVFQLLCQVAGETERKEAWDVAQALLETYAEQKIQANLAPQLRIQLQNIENRLLEQQQFNQSLQDFNHITGLSLTTPDALTDYANKNTEQIDLLNQQIREKQEHITALRQQQTQLNAQYQEKTALAPSWLVAKSALERLEEQVGTRFAQSQAVMQFMQSLFEKERELTFKRDEFARQRQMLDEQITRLSQGDGAEDPRLSQLAEQFQGVLLSELYDDVPVEDAPYFSALYGPARHGIVVRDLNAIKAELANLTDCPDDVYFIEGDPNAFDDNVYASQEWENGVMVRVSQRELRYSRFPEISVFGRLARESRCEVLQTQRDEIQAYYANLAFDVQKTQRLGEQFNQFVGLHLALAFQPNPEESLRDIQQQRKEIERTLTQITQQQQQQQQLLSQATEQQQLLTHILPHLSKLDDQQHYLDERENLREALTQAQADEQFVKMYHTTMTQLASLVHILRSDPAHYEDTQQTYEQIKAQQKHLQQRKYLLAEVVQRQAHFAYADCILVPTDALHQQLRHQLEALQQQREDFRDDFRQKQTQTNEYQRIYIELNSALQEKNHILQELLSEVGQLGIHLDEEIQTRARMQRDNLQTQLTQIRQRHQFVEKQLTLIESESQRLTQQIHRAKRDYQHQRQIVVASKMSWCIVQHLSRQANIEKRLNRRELRYLSREELRSMSDKALGALRIALADNEYLRDSLRASEDSRKPENKVQFFMAVYEHLRQRIRQDILHTNDPIDAIEQMEIELARLTEELTRREQKLAISTESVANIMNKTIQREQHRIRQLNQGLQNITFGQVKSVRLVVDIRESHCLLLDALSKNKDEYQDLFNDNRITFSEAMAKLYQRLNPHIDMGQRTPQTIGEALLDYRNYLDLEVEVYRGTDGWLRAESGALSTGEAIGTGMSILLMVVQSWEEESRRLRAKDILPCRLLFLDEAARLDAKSIATLFELCERLDMQLLIAAPENISPEKGTTYKLVRKITNNQEYVHVVGLRGFGARE